MLGGDAFRAVWASAGGHSIVPIPGSEAAILSTLVCGYSPLPGQTLHSLPGGPSSPILQWNGDFQVFEYGFPVLSFSTCNFQFCLASLFAGPGSGWHCLLLRFWGLDNGHLCPGSFSPSSAFCMAGSLLFWCQTFPFPAGWLTVALPGQRAFPALLYRPGTIESTLLCHESFRFPVC